MSESTATFSSEGNEPERTITFGPWRLKSWSVRLWLFFRYQRRAWRALVGFYDAD